MYLALSVVKWLKILCRPLEAHEALPVRQHRTVAETKPNNVKDVEEVGSCLERHTMRATLIELSL